MSFYRPKCNISITHKLGACRTISCNTLIAVRTLGLCLVCLPSSKARNSLLFDSNKGVSDLARQDLLEIDRIAGNLFKRYVQQTTRWGGRVQMQFIDDV
jgi:hypothetical protein